MFGVSVIFGEVRGEPTGELRGEACGEACGDGRGEAGEVYDCGVVRLLLVGLSGVRNADSILGGGQDLGLQSDGGGGGGNEAGDTVLPLFSNIL